MSKEVTPEMIEQIKVMRASGMPKRKIADALHIRLERIWPIIEGLGIKLPSREEINWPAENIERLKSLWEQGYSARIIARKMGGYTRNSILGKLNRLGLTQRSAREGGVRASSGERTVRKRPVPTIVEPLQIDGRNITIMDLEADMCRWPIGDPRDSDFHFCGHPSAKGRSYCEHHLSRSIEKPREDSSHVRKTIPTVWLRGIAA